MSYQDTQHGRQIYFECYSGEKLPVALIHGWGANCRVWDTIIPALWQTGHRVVTFDQRGCGRSDKDFNSATIAEASEDLMRILDALDIDRVVLNGWSLGGAIAVETAAMLGPRCAGVISTAGATPRFTETEDFPYGTPPGSVAEMVAALRVDRANFLKVLAGNVCARPVGEAVTDWLWQIFMANAPLADQALAELDDLEQRESISSLDVPLLSVVGAKDEIVAPEIGRQAARIADQGQLVEFEDSGHAPFLEQSERYGQTVIDFLKTL